MSWQDAHPDVYQALKLQKSVLFQLTPNKAAAAEVLKVRPSTVEGWCNPAQVNPNMPLALVSRHPRALELLQHHAYEIGYQLVPVMDEQQADGEINDELLNCVQDLGQVSEKFQAALKDLNTPGRVDGAEAREILRTVQRLLKDVTEMQSELTGIISAEMS